VRATIWVDGRRYEVAQGRNLLEVCLGLGLDLPYFCWHPALGSVGACRQCAVQQFRDQEDTSGRLVMACMTPAADGTRIGIEHPGARDFRQRVIEWLMLNHPHDCPVCDEGGECHLQDMTVMTGHDVRRSRFPKRTYRNQDLGPLVNHEMNRCIQCYRCVRFYRGHAGGDDLDVFGAHDHVWFGRHEDGALESEFAGNLVEVCPTGVFTDKSLKRHSTRKWDLTTAPSVCVHCGLGCHTTPGERYGELRRIRARYSDVVNGDFLCDRGRYGYEFVNDERRIRRCLAPHGQDAPAEPLPAEEALDRFAGLLAAGGRVLGVGSPRASLESNVALRETVGADRFVRGLSRREAQLLDEVVAALGAAPTVPTLREVEEHDAVLVLGEDVPNTAPMLALALRQAVLARGRAVAAEKGIAAWNDAAVREAAQDARHPLFVATPAPTRLDPIAASTLRAAPEEIERLARLVTRRLQERAAPGTSSSGSPVGGAGSAPQGATAVSAGEGRAEELDGGAGLPMAGASSAGAVGAASEDRDRRGGGDADDREHETAANGDPGAGAQASALAALAARIADTLAAAGRPLVVCGTGCESPALLRAAAALARASGGSLFPVVPECDSVGLALLGGDDLETAAAAAVAEGLDVLLLLETDLFQRVPAATAERLLEAAETVVVIDHLAHRTAARAALVLPAATFAEGDGTLVNNEGRAQRFVQVFVPEGDVRESWRWLGEARRRAGLGEEWPTVGDVGRQAATRLPALARWSELVEAWEELPAGHRLPRAPHRYSGRTAMTADRSVHEPKPPADPDSPYSFTMEGWRGPVPAALASEYWAPRWNSIQALNRFQEEIAGPLRGGEPGVRLVGPGDGPRQPPASPGGAVRREGPDEGGAQPGRTARAHEAGTPEGARPDTPPTEPGRMPATLRPVPLHFVFGSEELSSLAPGIAALAPEPHAALAPADGERLGLADGARLEVTVGSWTAVLPLRLLPGLAAGTVGLPRGLAGLEPWPSAEAAHVRARTEREDEP
jgi:NADH-quinone oxidoreductase subunit G